MQTIILGKRSYISKYLSANIKNSKIYSLEDFIDLYKKYYYRKKINLIINSFYPTLKLNSINNFLNIFYSPSIFLNHNSNIKI